MTSQGAQLQLLGALADAADGGTGFLSIEGELCGNQTRPRLTVAGSGDFLTAFYPIHNG